MKKEHKDKYTFMYLICMTTPEYGYGGEGETTLFQE